MGRKHRTDGQSRLASVKRPVLRPTTELRNPPLMTAADDRSLSIIPRDAAHGIGGMISRFCGSGLTISP